MSNLHYLNQLSNPIWDLLREIGGHSGFPHPGQHENAGQEESQTRSHAQGQATESQRAPDAGEQSSHGENIRDAPAESRSHYYYGRGGSGGRGVRCSSHLGPHQHHGRRQAGWGSPLWVMNQAFWTPGNGQTDEKRSQTRAEPVDLNAFLHNLGSQIGTNLREVLKNTDNTRAVDFIPRADIFDTQSDYIVHVSLPGAQKQDISVDYDTVKATLCLAGVVSRPGMDEALSSSLVMGGRDSEVGVFERQIHLGTRSEPANVDVDKISAKLSDGIMVIRLPKLGEREPMRRVPVEKAADYGNGEELRNEKESTTVKENSDSGTETGDTKRPSTNPDVVDEQAEEDYITVDVD